MGRNRFDYTHADTGEKPNSALDFQTNGRPQSQNFDWWWYNVIENINAHANEFDRLDSDGDGTVDESDYSLNSDKLDGKNWSDIQSYLSNNFAEFKHGNEAHTDTYSLDSHLHDSRYYRPTGNDEFVVEVRANDPSNPQDGRMWILE